MSIRRDTGNVGGWKPIAAPYRFMYVKTRAVEMILDRLSIVIPRLPKDPRSTCYPSTSSSFCRLVDRL